MSEEGGGTTGPGAQPPKPPPDPGTIHDPDPPSAGSPNGESPEDMSVGELVFEISDRASVLVREEIELAKTEVTEKLNKLMQGSVAALVAGVFVLAALAMIMHGIAWLLNDLFFGDNWWAGFLVEAGFFLLLAAGGGLYAYRSFKKSSPPVPEMAIEEAKEIKATFDKEESS